MSLIDRIRHATKPLHLETETTFVRLLRLDSVSSYVRTLNVFHAFHSAWEVAVRQQHDTDVDRLMADRWRVADLVNDLAHFGESPERPSKDVELPDLSGARLLGSLYVMEGSTLGGQEISKVLERSLGLTGDNGRSYFKGKGTATMPRWRQFLSELTRLAQGRPEDDVISGATDTFGSLNRWFLIQGSSGHGSSSHGAIAATST